MKKIYTLLAGGLVLAATPSAVFAQDTSLVDGWLEWILDILDLLVLIILALALVFFLWGVAKFILNAGDPSAQSEGKQIMFWGLIALFVMVSVWGLLAFIQNTIGIDDEEVERPAIFED